MPNRSKARWVAIGLLVLVSLPLRAHTGPDFPQVSVGENPRRSFGGTVVGGTSEPIFTVPSDQELILTMIATNTTGVSAARSVIHGFDFLADSDVVLSGYILSGRKKASIGRGDGRLRVPAGATLYARLQGPGSGDFYVQGFLVAAGSPYRSYNGTTAAVSTTVMTADPVQDFIVRTVVTDCPSTGGAASILVNGSTVVPDSADLTILDHSGTFEGPFVQGRGALVVPAGETLGLSATPPCDYYIDGEYVTP